ncbi:hypothetical protein [Limisalsivibrio acetivorans]|uniref:hypothetical protein n=1 Tax=Limisalsivibrio acetivorans TaxID=1304888 RepID=UPI0003B33489|nr:hypothetical protein [Limisalsivibrio acetivorans]
MCRTYEKQFAEKIASGKFTREHYAQLYVEAMYFDVAQKHKKSKRVDFKMINQELLKRYAPSGLEYIKELAWRIVYKKKGGGVK